ncbi:VOC family protein [Thalassobius sp. Cn5-15]|uniref:VOC family protein n=1 Tax=Thalassobius sp. Cn5-15 TaxID=2917763 RepID=UPI001EF3030C|nr:VOC family protein [Thalassobius sp. Cn5-15]MCG7494735.1 VOC family protein [Thalassobius sp. Cn5-15]
MCTLDTLTLKVRDPDALRQFYCDVLGMQDQPAGAVGYGGGQCALRFEQGAALYEAQPTDTYWKIALSVPDIELAVRQLRDKGINVSDPRQFRDVGYLAHFSDPEGFAIELIDHWFQGDRPANHTIGAGLGGGAHLSLITLRCADIAALEPKVLALGLRPYSVQPVTPYGFTLYFYGNPDHTPPSADLSAVENRTWTYQRRETVLELQHRADGQVTDAVEGEIGYAGLQLAGATSGEGIGPLGITLI